MANPQPPSSPESPSPVTRGTVSFENTEVAFRYKTNDELSKSLLLFNSIQSPVLMALGPKLVNLSLKLHLPVRGMLRRYFFDQFCGGTNLKEASRTIDRLSRFGVHTVLDYAVEGEKSERGFDAVLEELLRIIDFGSEHPAVAFVAAKLTGIGPAEVMTKRQAGRALTPEEERRLERLQERLLVLCQRAADRNQPIYIDAEETWFQDVVDDFCERMMLRFNREKPLIYTTIQMYRRDRLDYLHHLAERISSQGAIPAVKLVRGAYMEKEARRAQELGYPNPIQPNKQATDADFDAALAFILERIERFGLCIGSHNEKSNLMAANWIDSHGLPRNHPHVNFSQLYGMSDNITFNLAAAGFNVSKYLPYGPIEAATPYLFRRAQENSSVKGQSTRELDLIRREVKRRKRK